MTRATRAAHKLARAHSSKRSFLFAVCCVVLCAGMVTTAQAQSGTGLDAVSSPGNVWTALESIPTLQEAEEPWVRALKYSAFQLSPASLEAALADAPLELTEEARQTPKVVYLPTPEGKYARFYVVESPIMEPELAAKYPKIKTYLGQGIDDPFATVRFSSTPEGFQAQVLSPDGGYIVEPYSQDRIDLYASYYASDAASPEKPFECLVETPLSTAKPQPSNALSRAGATLRTYRLAVAATGEYTLAHGGTVASGLAAIVETVNRLNLILEVEVAVRLILVANNDQLVFTNPATDPYTNNDSFAMLGQNQAWLDANIGSANYDVGHVFGTSGSGVGFLGAVCNNSIKAGGVSGGFSAPVTLSAVMFTAHEFGHQFNANHSWNGVNGFCTNGNRNSPTAYEPGSGTTIMSYAGICNADNLASDSDPYYHSISFDEIITFVSGGGGSACALTPATGNGEPTVNAGGDFTIPANTPFELTASGSDPNGDPLTYNWEQRDLGPPQAAAGTDNGSSPIFRSFPATSNPTRTFPRLSDLLNNTTVLGEQLPSTDRTLNFRATVRDNRAGGGGVDTDDMTVTVSTASGPFLVTSPNTTIVASEGFTVTWDVANTTASPVNAANVNILLSVDGGLTYPHTLATATPNDGSQLITLPTVDSTTARIKVQGSGNVFFDVSDVDFTVEAVFADPAELFDAGDLDLEGRSVTFSLTQNCDYTVCSESVSALPFDTTNATTLTLGDDDSVEVPLSNSEMVSLFCDDYASFHVGSNGYVTFLGGDTGSSPTLANHFDVPRISGLFTDLDPNAGGKVSWEQFADRAVVTWEDVPATMTTDTHTFQVEMFFSGQVRVSWLDLDTTEGLVGLSSGNGIPAAFVDVDMSESATCGDLTELFEGDNDLAGLSVLLIPDGSCDYRAFAQSVTELPTDPAGGTALNLLDDSFNLLSLSMGRKAEICCEEFGSFYVGSNGYITFGEGDIGFVETLSAHFSRRRIAALFDNLDPEQGGTFSWKELDDRAAVTWENVPEHDEGGANTFQIELFYDGRIRISWTAVTATDGLAGISCGAGEPPDFLETDLSALRSIDEFEGLPLINPHPASAFVLAGTPVTFTVGAKGTTPFTYQWREDGMDLGGETSTTLAIASAQLADEADYDCVVTNSEGSMTSDPAVLDIIDPPVVTSDPTTQTVVVGDPVSFVVTATGGAPLSYQWRKGGMNISGATSSTLTIASAVAGDAGLYDCVVSNMDGSDTSNSATLTVNSPPQVTLHPVSQRVDPGSMVSFTVAAEGTTPFSYQWRLDGMDIGGAASPTYMINSVGMSDLGAYDCVVSNTFGMDTSNVANLTSTEPPVITGQPGSVAALVGDMAQFTVAATGDPTISYQWQKNGTPIGGETDATYKITSVVQGDEGEYDCVVFNGAGAVNSTTATLTILTPPDHVFSLAFTSSNQGWIGQPFINDSSFLGSAVRTGSGLCMTVNPTGKNGVQWRSPTNLFSMVARTVYRARIFISSTQNTQGRIPVWDFNYINIQDDDFFLNFGGRRWFIDTEGGASGVGLPNGLDEFVVFFAPAPIDTPQWNGDGALSTTDHAFSAGVSSNTGIRFIFRVLDFDESLQASERSGTICVGGIVIESFPLAQLDAVATTIYQTPISSTTHRAFRPSTIIDPLTTAVFDNFANTLTYQLPSSANATVNPIVATLGPDIAALPLFITDPNTMASVRNPAKLFPVPWELNTLYRGRVAISGPSTMLSGLAQPNPVDVIDLIHDVYTIEVGGEDFVTSGDDETSGGMGLAGSPLARSITDPITGGQVPEWHTYFYGNNVTDSLIDGSNSWRVQADFFNRADIGIRNPKAQTGTDPFVIHSMEIDRINLQLP